MSTMKVKPQLTQVVINRTLEAMNVIYLCSTIINHTWMINKDVKLGSPNLNNFNKRIGNDSLEITKQLNCKPKDTDMADERAIQLYRAINLLSQYNTEDLEEFNNLTEQELLKIN